MKGFIHLYCGDGKGKTTAAVGLSVRAAGAMKRVVFVQFLKDGASSEIGVLRSIPGVRALHADTVKKWFRDMTAEERETARADYTKLLEDAFSAAADADMLVLDEAVAACNHRLVDEARLLELLRRRPDGLEVVLTGRTPSAALLSQADYITEMKSVRHPFGRGVAARRGIER